MFVATRVMRAHPSRMPEAVAFVSSVVQHINSTHGVGYRVGIQVGGDPSAIGVSNMYESLADYQAFLDAMGADEAVQQRISDGTDHIQPGAVEDTIWSVVRPPSEPQEFTSVNAANVRTTQVVDAVAFALEGAEHASSVLGHEIGVATALTGDRSRLIWVGNNASLADVQADNDTLMADADYTSMFKRSEGLFVESTLVTTIWRTVPLE